jgi:hypothetical protein
VGVPYLDARSALATGLPSAVGVASVVGPAGPYLENLSAAWSAPQVREGTLAYPLPAAAPVPWLALDDLADAVAEALVAEDPPARQVLAGPEALTGDQLADAVAAGTGHEVVYRTVSHTEYGDRMTPHVGEEAGRGIAGFYAPPPPGAPGLPAPDPSLLRTGRTTVREWAARQPGEGPPPGRGNRSRTARRCSRCGRQGSAAQPSVAAGHDPAVDVPHGAAHPARLLGQQEGDDGGHVGRRPDAAERVEGVEAGQDRVDLLRGPGTPRRSASPRPPGTRR